VRPLGAFIGPLITGLLQTRMGFHYGFGAAAIGMALGLAQYVAFRRNLGTHGRTVPNPLPRSAIGWLVGRRYHGGLRNLRMLLSPIGLSVTTKLAPEAFRAQMMALCFFSVGLGTSMSGVLARYYDPAHEFAYFGIIGAVAVLAGVVVFAMASRISRLMEGVH
jgi:proton-dependent oligopeptide transporter, POT family